MKSLVVLDVVGLSAGLLGPNTPNLMSLAESGFRAELGTVLPAVTCSAQATLLTGELPRSHGIVGNGWFFRDLAEVWLWRQSSRLLEAPRVWSAARQRSQLDGLGKFYCANAFWWYAMGAETDFTVTPRPTYHADGRKSPDFYSDPPELRTALRDELGEFPLFHFWGPGADIRSTRWIGKAAEHVIARHRPHLTLVYLPHLDYDLQRFGPAFDGIDQALRDVDEVAGGIIRTARELEMEVVVLSEYGITSVDSSVSINRVLRSEGLLRVHHAHNGELLDPATSRAFAVSDHQVAHVYVQDADDVAPVRRLLEAVEGIDAVLDRDAQSEHGLDHPRSGELVAVSAANRWFDYYYWLDDARAPDFARTVDIHRKPGYDPLELFIDPARPFAKARIAAKLVGKKLGFRTLMDVVPLDTRLVGGSHGRLPERPEEGPVLLSSSRKQATSRLAMTEVHDLLLATMFDT
jgi:predicted AlkP superfamily pyrophosphatase or phosphodiesterase